MEREFNLIDEPWICVRDKTCAVREVSLKDALLRAHEYRELAGETKAQDAAVLRLLLAIMHTVFSRYDADGGEINREDMDEGEALDAVLDEWKRIWKEKRIPEKPVTEYFNKWHDRFWLFDEEYPFYQSAAVKGKGKPYPTAKMIGSLFESNNKKRLFSDRKNDGRLLSYPEAARWLLHINCFDDIAAKNPTPKKTWTGKLGLIYAEGDDLFETILLNYNAEADIENNAYISRPLWESDNSRSEFNRIISVPDNQAELLSLRSRSLYLCRGNGAVNGYYLSGGVYFDEEDVPNEQMTLWRGYSPKKGVPTQLKPKRHDSSLRAWQEFGSIAAASEVKENNSSVGQRMPGVITWIRDLCKANILDRQYVLKTATAAVIYDYGQATSLPVIDVISDSVTFHSRLLTEAGRVWRSRIEEEIEKCSKAAGAVRHLSINLQFACGASGDGITGDDAKMSFYDKIDRPFRIWLAELDPEYDEDYTEKLEKELRSIALRTGSEMASRAGGNAIFGRYVNGGKTISSSAEALNIYVYQIRKIFNKAGDN